MRNLTTFTGLLLQLLMFINGTCLHNVLIDAFSLPHSNTVIKSSSSPSPSYFSPRPTTTTTTVSSSRRHRHLSMSTNAGSTSEASSQNLFGVLSDAFTGVIFSILHAFDDDCGIEDSSKNLRVLWVRALLHQSSTEDFHDDIAQTLLPKTTRGLVASEAGAKLFEPILPFTEWIAARTEFIDRGLEQFLTSPVCVDNNSGEALECNVVVFGAGYDTRALRYRHRHDYQINFIEVDLPSVVEGKGNLYRRFQKEQDPEWDLDKLGPTLVPFDLNDCGGDTPVSLIQTLRTAGLKENVPTFFVWEAVLFYVNEDAVRNIIQEMFDFAQPGGNGDSDRAETMVCFTDSLKPFVDVPFTNEANKFFSEYNMDLLDHRSRWGGAVHFALAATKKEPAADNDDGSGGGNTSAPTTANNKAASIHGTIGKFVSDQLGGLVNSYTPTQANNPKLLEDPSFDNAWYAVGYPWQIDGYENAVEAALAYERGETSKTGGSGSKPFATRLWGEPIVIYRDANGDMVAMADVCPHRSAPLSMGTVENGELVCFYHGWKFGAEGKCSDIPTLQATGQREADASANARYKNRVDKANCGNNRAVVEHEGLVFVWRGNVLEADPSLLPTKRKGDMETIAIDSVLDYSVDYSYIVENNLDSPHLFYLHDGSVPPIEDIGLVNENLSKLQLKFFTDDCGYGHLGKLGSDGRPKKLIRFDPPNIVRHGGVSGFEEEFHIIPVAPHRTRVLIRQHLPKGPILSTITSVPYLKPALTALVNSWNYHIGLEDAAVMQGQAHRIEDWGAPRMTVGGLGDDLIMRYWKWRQKAHDAIHDSDLKTPYFTKLANNGMGEMPAGIPTGTAFGDIPETVQKVRAEAATRRTAIVGDDGGVDPKTGKAIGSWGIKQNYIQNTPPANFPPMNYKPYANLLVFDDLVKSLITGQEPSSTMIKKKMSDISTKTEGKTGEEPILKEEEKNGFVPALVAASVILTVFSNGGEPQQALAKVDELMAQMSMIVPTQFFDLLIQ